MVMLRWRNSPFRNARTRAVPPTNQPSTGKLSLDMFSATVKRSIVRPMRPRVPASARALTVLTTRRFLIPQVPSALTRMPEGFSSTVGVRFNSTWQAPVVTYETVKRKSQQPSPVSVLVGRSFADVQLTATVQNSYIVDVREPDEVAQGSIPSSVSIPLSGLAQSLALPDIEFEAKHGFKKPAKDEELIFYCRSGKRSTSASEEAHSKGFNK